MYNIFNNFYTEPLFRPPSEADSLILQITEGCTWNKCAFCEMYSSKPFKIKTEEQIFKEIDYFSNIFPETNRVFLADGNPMVLSFEKLSRIVNKLHFNFKKLRRITTYSLPRDIISKSDEELKLLRNAGLSMLYIGIESGDDKVLEYINKGETSNSTITGLLKAKNAGLKLSTIILNGVGGKKFTEQHAINSAKILNAIQPEYASLLVLSFPLGIEHYKSKFKSEFIEMNIEDILHEVKLFIENTELNNTVFRSNHASNYLVLSGMLHRDKQQFLDKINFAIKHPELSGLRKEWQRGL